MTRKVFSSTITTSTKNLTEQIALLNRLYSVAEEHDYDNLDRLVRWSRFILDKLETQGKVLLIADSKGGKRI